MGSSFIVARHGALRDSLTVTVASLYVGDLVITGPGDVSAFAAAGYETVRGSVKIIGTALEDLSGLETLQAVDGNMTIRNNPALKGLAGLSGLKSVHGLTVADNAALLDTDLGSLETVSGMLSVSDNTALAGTVGLPHVRELGGLSWAGNSSAELSFPALEEIRGDLSLKGTNARTVTFGALRCVTGVLWVLKAQGIEALSFPVLTTTGTCGDAVGGPSVFAVTDNPNLASLEVPSLVSAAGAFHAELNALTSLDLSSLRDTPAVVVRQSGLGSLTLSPDLRCQQLTILDTDLPEIDLPATGGQLWIASNRRLRTLSTPPAPVVQVSRNRLLESIDLQGPDAALLINENSALTTITGSGFDRLLDGQISDNPSLRTISFPDLTAANSIRIFKDSLVTDLDFARLASLDHLEVSNLPLLEDLNGFAALRSGLTVPGSTALTLYWNRSLKDISGLDGLGDASTGDPIIDGNVEIVDNLALGDSIAEAFIARLDAKYPGAAVSGSVTVSGNHARPDITDHVADLTLSITEPVLEGTSPVLSYRITQSALYDGSPVPWYADRVSFHAIVTNGQVRDSIPITVRYDSAGTVTIPYTAQSGDVIHVVGDGVAVATSDDGVQVSEVPIHAEIEVTAQPVPAPPAPGRAPGRGRDRNRSP